MAGSLKVNKRNWQSYFREDFFVIFLCDVRIVTYATIFLMCCFEQNVLNITSQTVVDCRLFWTWFTSNLMKPPWSISDFPRVAGKSRRDTTLCFLPRRENSTRNPSLLWLDYDKSRIWITRVLKPTVWIQYTSTILR